MVKQAQTRRASIAELDAEIWRLTNAIASGGQLSSLLEALQARETRRADLAVEIAALDAAEPIRINRRDIGATVRGKLKDWRALLRRDVEGGRQLQREVLAGPLRFRPDGKQQFHFEGEAAIGRLLEGTIGSATKLASLTGFEPVLPP